MNVDIYSNCWRGQELRTLVATTHRHGATVIDPDRPMWAKQHDGVLLPDGMHLSDAGHERVAEQVASLLS